MVSLKFCIQNFLVLKHLFLASSIREMDRQAGRQPQWHLQFFTCAMLSPLIYVLQKSQCALNKKATKCTRPVQVLQLSWTCARPSCLNIFGGLQEKILMAQQG